MYNSSCFDIQTPRGLPTGAFIFAVMGMGWLIIVSCPIFWSKRCHGEKVISVFVEPAGNGSYQILGLGIAKKPAVIQSA